MRHLVSYDITDDASRRRVADLLQSVLTRVQYSVFEGDAPTPLVRQTVAKALAHLAPETDSIRVYALCESCAGRIDVFGRDVEVSACPLRVLRGRGMPGSAGDCLID